MPDSNLETQLANARLAGAGWDQIETSMAAKVDAATKAGATTEQIQQSLGLTGQDPATFGPYTKQFHAVVAAHQRALYDVQAGAGTPPPEPANTANNILDAYNVGASESATGYMLRSAEAGHPVGPDKVMPNKPSVLMSLAHATGNIVEDLPMYIGLQGLQAGPSALAGAEGGAAVPGAGETGLSELGGGFLGLATSAVAKHATTWAAIQSLKSYYADMVAHGNYKSAADAATRIAGIVRDAEGAAAEGGSVGFAGEVAPILTAGLKSGVLKAGGKYAAEYAALLGSSAAVNQRLPTDRDYIDNAVLMAGLFGAHAVGAKMLNTTRVNAARDWANDGVPVPDQGKAALTDLVARDRLTIPRSPEPPPGSSWSHTPDGRFVIPRPSNPHGDFGGVQSGGTVGDDFDRSVLHLETSPNDPKADIRVSPAGAIGRHQIMPATAKQYNGNDYDTNRLFEPGENARVYQQIKADLQRKFPGDLGAQLAAYNAGPGKGAALERAGPGTRLVATPDKSVHGGIRYEPEPSIRDESHLPLETQRYLANARRVTGGDLKGEPAGTVGPDGVVQEAAAVAPPPRLELPQVPFTPATGEGITTTRYKPGEEPEHAEGEEEDQGPKGLEDAARWESTDGRNPYDIVMSREALPEKDPSTWENIKKFANGIYLDMFKPDHPMSKVVDAVLKGRPLPDEANPKFLYRVAELSNSRSQYMYERKMLDTHGRETGKGLKEILKPFEKNSGLFNRLKAYAFSKFAVEKASQSKETGIDLVAAQEVIRQEEHGGVVPEGMTWRDAADKFNVPVVIHDENSKLMRLIGPHYSHMDTSIHLSNLEDPDVEAKYGKGLTSDVVAAHEMGHAIAFKYGMQVGKGDWSHLTEDQQNNISDELEIVSRRFKPGLWKNAAQRTHVTKQSELIADAVATWMTDPVARTHMPEFEKLMDSYGINVADDLGAKPEKWGTPVQQAFQELQDWQNGTLKYLKDSGVISRDTYIKSVAENAARIPGYRVDDDIPLGGKGPGPGSTVYNSVKGFKGSDKMFGDMIKAMMQDSFLRVELANRNMANKSLSVLAQDIGVGRPAPTEIKPISTQLSPAEMRKLGLSEDSDGVLKIFRAMPGVKPNQVPIFDNGKMTPWEFDDPDLMRFLRGYDQKSLGTLDRALAGLTRITRGLIVMNPAFPVHLMSYDMPWQFITKPGARNTVADTVVGLGHVIGDTDSYHAWLRSGGAERVFDGLSQDKFIKARLMDHADPTIADMARNTIKAPYELLKNWASALMQAERAGRYIRGVQQGESPLRAGVASSEAAFHRASFGGPETKRINATVPFFAAYLNSLEQTVRSQFGIGRTITGEKWNPAATTAKALALITLPTLALWAQNRDKEWYKAAPDWQKDNGLLFHFGPDDGTGHTVFWKYPPLISVIYAGLPRRMMEAYYKDNPHAWDGFQNSMGASLLPPGGLVSYNVALPFVEHMANHSFFENRPLVPDDLKKNTLTPDQGLAYSTVLSQKISRFVNDMPILRHFNLSPPVIDNYINNWGGTMGQAAMQTLDVFTPRHERTAATDWSEAPLVRSFFSRYPAASAQPVVDFQNRMDHFSAVHGSLMSAITQGDLGRFQELAEQNPTASLVHAMILTDKPHPADMEPYIRALQAASTHANVGDAQLAVAAMKAMTTIRQFVAQVQAAPTEIMSPTDKRQIVDQALSIRQVIAERGSDVLDDAGVGIDRPRPNPAAKVALRQALSQMGSVVSRGVKLPPANPNAPPEQAPPPEQEGGDNTGLVPTS